MSGATTNLSETFYSNILHQLPGLVVVGDVDSNCIYINRITAKLFGYPNEESFIGKSPFDMRCPAVESADQFLAQNNMVIENETPITSLDIHQYASDKMKILITKKNPFYVQGKIAGSICLCTEIKDNALSQLSSVLINLDKKFRVKQSSQERSYIVKQCDIENGLSKREMECLFYLIRGLTKKEIGKKLQLSHRTIEFYFERIKNKANCHSKSDLVEYAIEQGLFNFIPASILPCRVSEGID